MYERIFVMIDTHFTIIVAVDESNGIGKNNSIPWHCSGDLKIFKELTLNQEVVMGRKTYESIPCKKDSKKLPKRSLHVLSTSMKCNPDTLIWRDLNTFLKYSDLYFRKVFVIGGGEIYRQFLPFTNEIIRSVIKGNYECDVNFPINLREESNWVLESSADKKDYVLEFWKKL